MRNTALRRREHGSLRLVVLVAGVALGQGLAPLWGPVYGWTTAEGKLSFGWYPRLLAAPGLVLLEGILHLDVPASTSYGHSPPAVLRGIVLMGLANTLCWAGIAYALASGAAARLIRRLSPRLTVAALCVGLIPAFDIGRHLLANSLPVFWWWITSTTAWPAFAAIDYLSRGAWCSLPPPTPDLPRTWSAG